ncbi:MAG: hypothetical protein HQK63_00740 [Desulfamplus sp.]|nr:hypothetical protein [Desulfamplus sp.]
MKKVLMFVVLSVFVVGMSVPATALEVDFSGSFYVEGILNSAPNMLDSDGTANWRQMRLRVETNFQVSDNLKLTTRFDALEKVLSSTDSAFDNMEDDDNIDFDRAYLTYISPIGMFELGRLKGITWGTSFCDDESDTDRIKYTVPIEIGDGKLYMVAVAEKVTENNTMIDDDNDKYYLGGVYKTEAYATGLLSAMYNFNKFQDPGQKFAFDDLTASYEANRYDAPYREFLQKNSASDDFMSYATWYGTGLKYAGAAKQYGTAALTYKAAAEKYAAQAQAYAAEQKMAEAQAAGKLAQDNKTLAETNNANYEKALASMNALKWSSDLSDASHQTMARGLTNDAKVYLLSPFFQGKFGDLSIEAELDYVFGTLEYDARYNAEDRDVKGFAYFAQGSYDYSPFTAQLGFAHSSGDADYNDKDVESMGYVSPGLDWEKLFILNSDYHGMNGTLGNGVGNHVGTGYATASIAMLDGYQMLYGGVDYAVTDAITLGFIAAMSKADALPEDNPLTNQAYDDDQGMEYNFSFEWAITDNLTYKAIAAYLDGGDYWTTRKTGTVEKTATGDDLVDPEVYALFHRLTLTF